MEAYKFFLALAMFWLWFFTVPATLEEGDHGGWNYHGEVTWARWSRRIFVGLLLISGLFWWLHI